jgi:hypothetical protein
MEKLMEKTELLDFDNKDILLLIENKKWKNLNEKEMIRQIYEFVRDEIQFGYNIDDAIPASAVLKDGYGQCNTKGILFMALLRAVKVPCRIHGFTVDKIIQKGALSGLPYFLSPKELVHSWIELYYQGKWFNLEGFILDKLYLNKVQEKFSNCNTNFCGYAVAVKDLRKPQIDWNENDTYIQSEGIIQDFGVFNSPDELFSKHFQKLSPLKKYLFRKVVRHLMNKNVQKVRKSKNGT